MSLISHQCLMPASQGFHHNWEEQDPLLINYHSLHQRKPVQMCTVYTSVRNCTVQLDTSLCCIQVCSTALKYKTSFWLSSFQPTVAQLSFKCWPIAGSEIITHSLTHRPDREVAQQFLLCDLKMLKNICEQYHSSTASKVICTFWNALLMLNLLPSC